jgi:hypothetical protein
LTDSIELGCCRLFQKFKKPEGVSELNISGDDLDSLYGGLYMPADDFKALVKRVTDLSLEIDWLTILGGSASGYISRSTTPEQLKCVLWPLKNKNARGLSFETQVVAVPAERLETLKQVSIGINSSIGTFNGFEISFVKDFADKPPILWFKTIMFQGRGGFRDSDLRELIEENFDIGNMAFQALLGVHLGQLSRDQGVAYFRDRYHKYRNDRGKPVVTFG